MSKILRIFCVCVCEFMHKLYQRIHISIGVYYLFYSDKTNEQKENIEKLVYWYLSLQLTGVKRHLFITFIVNLAMRFSVCKERKLSKEFTSASIQPVLSYTFQTRHFSSLPPSTLLVVSFFSLSGKNYLAIYLISTENVCKHCNQYHFIWNSPTVPVVCMCYTWLQA